MRKIVNIGVFVMVCMIMTSCVVAGLTNDYNKLPDSWKAIVVPLKSFDQVSRGEITKINGMQLREELKKYPEAVVYIISNHRQDIVSIKQLEDDVQKRGIKLFLVMDGYFFANVTYDQRMYSPVFVMDNDFYKKKYADAYKRYFINDMLGRDRKTKLNSDFLFFFKNGESVSSQNSYKF
ncbi:hypothetical protein [Flavobacterium sp. HSC-61S13]|uniref:hypothetical protein n=1 Tax=Flavobacterium sp. HSC-61S13 TaxID=2910963 RepID=UPI00209D7278|nr:hypothetical protein [Flavobacterium sp. HSC-61S13]MCP1995267.1 hypothetical protein [Flavobacterium sp. HSC-61S13]